MSVWEARAKVIICGGVLAPQVQASAGTFAADFLNQLNMDAAVFESEGFHTSSGPTSSDLDYSQVQRLLSKTPDSVSFWPRAAKPVILL